MGVAWPRKTHWEEIMLLAMNRGLRLTQGWLAIAFAVALAIAPDLAEAQDAGGTAPTPAQPAAPPPAQPAPAATPPATTEASPGGSDHAACCASGAARA